VDGRSGNAGPSSGRPRFTGPSGSALRIVLAYAVVASVWIIFSDELSRAMTVNPDMLTTVAILKGGLFVLVTSGLLFLQIRSDFARLQVSRDRLSESERRFRAVIDVSPVPMTMSDADGRITFTNHAFASLIGYTLDDVPTIDAWWPKAYPDPAYRKLMQDTWFAEIERSRKSGDAFRPQEARIRCKDGTDRTMLISSGPLGPGTSDQVVLFYDITQRVEAEAAMSDSNERLEQVLRSVTGLIGKVVETRDPYTQGHEEGVARICRLIAGEMNLSPEDAEGIEVAALVHDVGKLAVPAEILTKPGKLTDLEFQLIKAHSLRGYEILKDIDFTWPVAETVLQHHERMDGSGYPGSLTGDAISLGARILMVADVIEAMGAHRPYRSALGIEAAMGEITTHPDKYDQEVIDACARLHTAGRITV